MKFTENQKRIFGIIWPVIVMFIVSISVSYGICYYMINVVPEAPDKSIDLPEEKFEYLYIPEAIELPEEGFEYFNISSSSQYQEAIEIVKLEVLPVYKFIVNNKTISVETTHIIKDNETQKIFTEAYNVEICNENILIGDKECYNQTVYLDTIFIHKGVSEDIKRYRKEHFSFINFGS